MFFLQKLTAKQNWSANLAVILMVGQEVSGFGQHRNAGSIAGRLEMMTMILNVVKSISPLIKKSRLTQEPVSGQN